MSREESIISPRFVCLQQELEAGNDKALEFFWKEISKQGTPLVEPVEGDKDQSWVTFLF
jgi:hypothetical protein